MPRMTTKGGYDFYETASAMQKAIRRNDPKVAGYFALEMFHSGCPFYVWRRLLTISAEDCWGETITTEVFNLYRSFVLVNEGRKEEAGKGRIFLSKAVLILCRSLKCRDADHLQNLLYDRKALSDTEIEDALRNASDENLPVPEYAYDVHTRKGRYLGRTKEDFFREEFLALSPRMPGLFDDLMTV